MSFYDARRWYWLIASDEGRVFSSSAAKLVPLSDPAYQAWLSSGNTATRIVSYPELYDVLIQQAPSSAAAAAKLFEGEVGFTATETLAHRLRAGVEVVANDDPGLNGTYPIDPETIAKLRILCDAAGDRDRATLGIPDISGQVHHVDATQLPRLCEAITGYLADLYWAEAIAAGGGKPQWPGPVVLGDES